MPTQQHASHPETTAPPETVEFVIGGMTCGSCAARVQRTLGRTVGVAEAEVNLATSRARVRLARPVPVQELRARVAKIGYSLAPVADQAREGATDAEATARRWWGYRVAAVAPAALFALVTMVRPALMAVTGWRVAALVVATVVEFVVGWPFLREAARRARRLTANMDTLVAVGTLAAYGFSVWELASGGMQVYFETAILLIAFLSLGRYLEARARGRAGQAIRARCWSSAPSRPGWSATTARSWSRSSRWRSRTWCGCGRARRSPSTAR
jgi:cation-transporting ATPase V/Cu+-exporting ATPase